MASVLRKSNRCEQLGVLGMLVGAPLLAAACSFLTPSTADYSREYGKGGESGGSAAGGGAENAAGNDSSGSGGSALGGAAGAGGESDAGAGGEAEEPDAPAVPGQHATTGDITLQPQVNTGLPRFVVLTAYGTDEASAQKWAEPPLYAPYASSQPAWWDNLVAEQLQARVPVVAFPTTGAYSLDATDLTGPGTMNPRQLSAWVAAVTRANATAMFQAVCAVDPSHLAEVSNKLHNKPASTAMDLSVASDWKDVFWLRAIKPFFDTIPKSYWFNYAFNNRPLIYIGALPAASYKNTAGNLSGLLTAVSDAFSTAYGMAPNFVLDASWFALDATVESNGSVVASNPWLEPPTTVSYAFTTYHNITSGSLVPGFKNGPITIPRTTTDSYRNEVSTLATGFSQGQMRSVEFGFVLVQGFTNGGESAGLYRSTSPAWSSSNQYLNATRSYLDPKTATLRLEAEGADRYFDTTAGNSGAVFRRGGDLDVRPLNVGGWAVTNTTAGEWLELADIDFSVGDYRITAQYSTPSADSSAKRLELVIDGIKQVPVTVPNTTNTDTFQTVILASPTLTHGRHTLRVRFLDGLIDLDWLFIKKISPVFNLKANTGMYLSASHGGGSNLNADSALASVWEQFTFDDSNGGTLNDGDVVNIQSFNGLYLGSTPTSGLAVTARTPTQTESFTVVTQDSKPVHTGSVVALRAADGKHYLTVVSKSLIDLSGTTIGMAQMLTMSN